MSYKSEYDEAREHLKKKEVASQDRLLEQVAFSEPRSTIKESFRWLVPEAFKTQEFGKNQIKIKGVALKSDIISRNKRKYIDEEVKRAARTLTGKPVTINHNNNRIVGNVEWAEYEDGALEYLAVVKKQPYVDMIREKDVRLKGVSVQAGYIHNRCVECGEQFYSEEAFKQHMKSAHSVTDGITEVHGIVFDALSLVTSPEVPGVPDTSLEIFETSPGALQLFETMLEERGYALQSPRTVGMSKLKGKMKYTHEDLDTIRKRYGWPISVNAMVLGEGCRWKAQGFDSGEACVSAMQGKVDDPEAFCYGPAEETKEQVEEPTEEKPESCPNGMVRDPTTGKCVSPDVVIEKIDEAFKRYKRTMEIDICNNLVKLERLFGSMNEKFTAIEKRLEKVETGENPHLQETEKLTIRIDNLEAKLKGQFKGHSKPLDKQSDTYSDPEKDMRESARKKR